MYKQLNFNLIDAIRCPISTCRSLPTEGKAGQGKYMGSLLYLHRMNDKPKDPLEGRTLEYIVTYLVEQYGWQKLGVHIPIRCFNYDPSIKSSLTFLRKTLWARTQVEVLYIDTIQGHII